MPSPPPSEVVCPRCGSATPPGRVCAVCSNPLPRSIRSNRAVVVLTVAIAIVALGILLAILGVSGTGPS